jgi:hypothetical protein
MAFSRTHVATFFRTSPVSARGGATLWLFWNHECFLIFGCQEKHQDAGGLGFAWVLRRGGGTIALSHDLAPFSFLRIPVAARDSIVNTVPGIPLLWRISPVISGQLTS